ncbi:hypothetical protein [Streptomyces sp. DSM 40750]|uniref:hypothetical protein n=1 Tax=Streptomyces sp. DSM 40750 TaxID=2801030 RepID=UPI00214C9436|nr:hypothetical protein [Streptomyces sp. DSM 40750]UUU22248.1 hypothetical protein JIX55_19100 [Streptomyces sp. DSM 40750]
MRIGVSLLILSLAPALACFFVFAVWLPSDMERYRDYGEAESCATGAPTEEWEDCLRTASFTVDSTKITQSRSGSYRATLSGAPFWNGTVAFGDPGPLLRSLQPGDRVTATVWRGDITALSRGGVRQRTSEEPRDEPQMTSAIGTFLGLLAALGLWFGATRLTGPPDRKPLPWAGYARPLLIALLTACAGVGLPSVWLGFPWWLVPTLVVPLMVCTTWLVHRHQPQPRYRDRRARS